jgi:hypothetical protein
MHEIHTEIIIDASKEVIWEILTDFPAYAQWNPFIVRVMGNASPGQRLFFVARVKLALVPVAAKILQFKEYEKFSWGGPGVSALGALFGAEHSFAIEELQPGRCRFINSEQMRGVVAHAFWPLIAGSKPAYSAMNEALKARAEGIR